MARINLSKYENEIISAYEVDDNYAYYKRDRFKCLECGVKIEFNRGINALDPHFKNWKKIDHLPTCEIANLYNRQNTSKNNNIKILISTILPRAERLKNLNTVKKIKKMQNRYFGKSSKRFLNALSALNEEELSELMIRTEDNTTVRIKDLILRQDQIIEKLELDKEAFVCILMGHTTKVIKVGQSLKIPMTYGGRYGNKQKFDLFIPASYISKNEKQISTIENKLIYCFGLPKINEYGAKIDLFSITHQIVIIKK